MDLKSSLFCVHFTGMKNKMNNIKYSPKPKRLEIAVRIYNYWGAAGISKCFLLCLDHDRPVTLSHGRNKMHGAWIWYLRNKPPRNMSFMLWFLGETHFNNNNCTHLIMSRMLFPASNLCELLRATLAIGFYYFLPPFHRVIWVCKSQVTCMRPQSWGREDEDLGLMGAPIPASLR